MNMLEMLRNAQGGDGLGSLARRFGVTPDQAEAIAREFLPAMSSGVKRQAETPDGLGKLAGMIRANDAADVFDAPDAHEETARAQGDGFLDALFGGAAPQLNEAVSANASTKTGVDGSLIQSMLPVIASMVLGGMQKRETNDPGLSGIVGGLLEGGGQASTQGSSGGLGGLIGGLLGGGASSASSSGGAADLLTQMFDADGDGSVADDLLEKFLGRR